MKIAVIHNLQRGGAARRLGETSRRLARRPDAELREILLSTARPLVDLPGAEGANGTSRACIDFRLRADGLRPLLRPPVRYLDDRALTHAWARVAEEIDTWQPDVVFANSCGLLHAAPPSLPSIDAPSLYYCDEPRRSDYDPGAIDATNRATRPLYAALRRRQRAADRAAVAAATRLATNSTFTADGILAAYGRPADVTSPGVADTFIPAPDSRTAASHALSVGTLTPQKGHDLAIRAIAQSRVGLGLIVVAPRPEQAEQARLFALAAEHDVPLRVLVGISDEQLAQLYRDAVVTLYLARQEPLGLVSLESQACGTPAIVSDEGGQAQTVDDGISGYRVPRAAEAAAAAIRAITDVRCSEAFRDAAARRPVLRYDDVAEETYRLLAEVAGHAAARAPGPDLAPQAGRA